MFKVAFFLTVFAALAASAPTTEPAGELSKRCFHNGGGWYWCALDVPKEDASAPATEIASREPHQNEKRCFHNGGGWYWCALDVPNEAASTPPANPPETAKVAIRELENNEKRCFHNGGGWYWCALDEKPAESREIDTSAR